MTGPRVLHVITGLGQGGAEAMLLKLVAGGGRYRHEIVSLAGVGDLGGQVRALGVPLQALAIHHPRLIPWSLIQLRKTLSSARDAVVVAWMNHGILLTTLAHRSARLNSPLIWNVRQSLGDMRCETRTTRAIIRLNARLSGAADCIVYNSYTGASDHEALGFDPSRKALIGNGFNLDDFSPDPTARALVRAELGIAHDEVVFGLFARVHAIKNHGGLIRAAELVCERYPKVRLLFVGLGADLSRPEFRNLFRSETLIARTLALGIRSDIARLTLAMDVGCNVSFQEGFSNAIGEAMASGLPCLVTDAGDSARIVGDAGIVCGSSSADVIAGAMIRFLEMGPAGRSTLGNRARRRSEEHFALSAVIEQYERLFDRLRRDSGLSC